MFYEINDWRRVYICLLFVCYVTERMTFRKFVKLNMT